MAKQVIRRDGTKQAFDENKIRKSIEGAAKEAGLAGDRIKAVVGRVAAAAIGFAAGKEEIATEGLRTFILAQLDQIEPAVAESWRKYDKARGRV